jgi:EAL domain-containing protein (putative c-di-GMP-specific phosphodiesterase class I)
MSTSALRDSPPASLRWTTALGLAVAAALLTAASRLISPIGDQNISLVWPAAGVMLAALIRFGFQGGVAAAAGLLVWAIWAFPQQPVLWATLIVIEFTAGALGAWLMGALLESLRKHKQSSVIVRTEWLYCLYVVAFAGAGIVAGVLVSATRQTTQLYTEFSWFAATGGYWLVQALGYITFAPLTLAIFSALGYADPRIPMSAKAFSWRTSIDWLTLVLGLLLALLLLGMIWAEQPGYARALSLWALPLMLWTAVRAPALPTYFTLALISLTMLPARTLAVHADHGDSHYVVYEIFEGVLITAIAVLITQVMQAAMHQTKAQQSSLEQQLRTDSQTGLLNETGLRQVLASTTPAKYAAVVLFYFPALPQLMSSLGNERAARVREALTERISALGQHAARLDVSTYCCLWQSADETSIEQSVIHTEEQLAGLRIRVGEGTVRLNCHAGVLMLDVPAVTNGEPFEEAVLAAVWQMLGVLQTPRSGNAVVMRMSDQLNLAAQERNQRTLLIRQALEQGDLEVYAQLIESNINPPGAHSPLMFEALARLRLPDGTILAPGAFLPVAEKHGLIRQIDRTMIQKTFAWFAARPDALQRLSRCSINLSGQSVSADGIAAEIRNLANGLNLPVGKFAFEITESEAIQDANLAVRAVADLRAAGFGTAIDDFGTGLATFAYLKRFEVDLIKIDGAFIRLLDDGVRRSEVDREIVRSIVRVAQSLGVKTAAEFVETQAIREHVTALGVHYSQGYGIAKPVPIAELFS